MKSTVTEINQDKLSPQNIFKLTGLNPNNESIVSETFGSISTG